MSKPAFTPGPYRMGATQFIVTTDDHVVAMTKVRGFDSNTFADDDTCIANTKFLSAAPDMYEALKAAHKLLKAQVSEVLYYTPEGEDDAVEASAILAQYEAALAKAEGRS